jgi:hypothetical protein
MGYDAQGFNILFSNNVSVVRGLANIGKSFLLSFFISAGMIQSIIIYCFPASEKKFKIGRFKDANKDDFRWQLICLSLWLVFTVVFWAFALKSKILNLNTFESAILAITLTSFIIIIITFNAKSNEIANAKKTQRVVLGERELNNIRRFLNILVVILILNAAAFFIAKTSYSQFNEEFLNPLFFGLLSIAFNLAVLGSIYTILPNIYDTPAHSLHSSRGAKDTPQYVIVARLHEKSRSAPIAVALFTMLVLAVCFFVKVDVFYPKLLKEGSKNLNEDDFKRAQKNFADYLQANSQAQYGNKNEFVIHPFIVKAKMGLAQSFEHLYKIENDRNYYYEAWKAYEWVETRDSSYKVEAEYGRRRIDKAKDEREKKQNVE